MSVKPGKLSSERQKKYLLITIAGIFLAVLLTVLGYALWNSNTMKFDQGMIGQTPVTLPVVKILVDQPGVYRIGWEDLEEFGLVDQNESDRFKLWKNGRTVPFWQDDSAIYFFGNGNGNRYATTDVYWLGTPEQLSQMSTRASQPSPRVASPEPNTTLPLLATPQKFSEGIIKTTRLEENILYNPLVEDGAPWLWQHMTAPGENTFEIELENVAPGEGAVTFSVWGSTDSPASPDHRAILEWNDIQFGEATWDGQGRYLIKTLLPARLIKEGQNELTIKLPGVSDASADVIYLDWIEIQIPGQYVAENDTFNFSSPGGQIQVKGFTGPIDIFDITQNDFPEWMATGVEADVGFDSTPGHQYLLVGPNGMLEPVRLEVAQMSPDLRNPDNAADYLVISTPDLLPELESLIEWRRKQGLAVMAIPIQTIYDQFNEGKPGPEAVRIFLDTVLKTWQVKPAYLFLVGDASYDSLAYQSSPEGNQIPTFFIRTRFGGETASDFGFAVPGLGDWPAPDGEKISSPELAVGRIPARTPEQVRTYVEKVINYESSDLATSGEWLNQILAIADSSEARFSTDASNFLMEIPEKFETELLAPADGQSNITGDIVERLNQGSWLAAYFGHGSLNMWGKDKLLSNPDVQKLENGRQLPIIIQMTCLTGLFTHPTKTSLAEALLFEAGDGAIATLAPTSLTLPGDQSYLSSAFTKALMDGNNQRLGEAFLAAQRQVILENPGGQDVLWTFLLFGDPALRILRADPGG